MAIGTRGGKLGFVIGPILAIPAMAYSVDWFGFSEDKGPWYGLVGWLLFGVIVAIAAGLLVRIAFNKLVDAEDPGF
jgi:hypothetical protein